MANLVRRKNNQIIVSNLKVAHSFFARAKGLLGLKNLENQEGLWIERCNSIHTWFMKFSIDCVFVDKTLKTVFVRKNIQPWGFVWPIWSARSVFELPSGTIEKYNIQIGDEFYVDN